MSSNCNHINPKCDPCEICTPPGVTNLPDCNPKDLCTEKTNISCVEYNGIDFSCLGVTNGDSLINVLLAILAEIFPIEYCCQLDGTILNYATTTSTTTTTTSTTTTSTSTTTTTTTMAPYTDCKCYQLTNTDELDSLEYSFVNCETRLEDIDVIGPLDVQYKCAVQDSIFSPKPGLVAEPLGLCLAGCSSDNTTTTTTTTTLPPVSCEVDGDCPPGFYCLDGVCTPTTTSTTTTTTSTTTTSTSTTTTTTTFIPVRYRYYPIVQWDSELCQNVGPTFVMRSVSNVPYTYVCIASTIWRITGPQVFGPTYQYEYQGIGGNQACVTFDFICS